MGQHTYISLDKLNRFLNRLKITFIQKISTGSTNGSISVDGTDIKVKGLDSAAYTKSTDYATAAQGSKADSAVQSVTTGTTNGTISVDGSDVAVKGLGSNAYTSYTNKSAASGGTDVSLVTTGEKYAWNNKVDKVNGKGLSTNDYTTTEKDKLSGIAAGAEVNQNAFSNVKVGSTTVAADGKTDTLELAGSNVTLTPDATNDKVTIGITKANVTDALGYTPPTTNTTYSDATQSAHGLMSVDDKKKLDGIAAGAQVNTITSVAGKTGAVTLSSSDVGLGNVGNFKAVSTVASQGLTDTEKANARANIGAGSSSFDGAYSSLSGKPTLGTASAKDVPSSGNASTSQVVMGNDTRLTNSRPASDVSAWAKASSKPTYTASEVGAIPSSLKGAASGVAELDANGLVPTSQLPSYVDDVLEYPAKANFPSTGETGKIYVDKTTNLTYRWSGTAYVEISPSLAIGTTSSTAFRGDYGNTAYSHATDSSRLTTAKSSGLYKIATTAQGHVASVTAVAKSDITGLGIPAQDTVNTAGSTDTSSKIYLIGATSQAANPQTYSHDTAYVGTDGKLYSGNKVVLTGGSNASSSVSISPNTTDVYSMTSTGSVTTGTANVPTKIDTSKFNGGSFTRGVFSQGTLPSMTFAMDSTDTKQLNISFNQGTLPTHANDTFTAASLASGFYTAGTANTPTAVTLPGRSSAIKAWTGYSSATAAAQTFTGNS